MRVVAGIYKGRNLKTLKGTDTRPTTMRVKESMFSALTSLLGSFEGLRVLDAFAGSGALGIESLSRGAAFALFFERSRSAAAIVKENLRSCGVEGTEAKVEVGETERLIMRKRPYVFDLVLFDPPYSYEPEVVADLVVKLEAQGSLDADSLICYELAKKNEPSLERVAHELKWCIVSSKSFGETAYVILRKE